jgi:hypothetical protein
MNALIALLVIAGPVSSDVKPACLPDSAPTAAIVVDRLAEIVTRRDGEMAVKRRVLSLPFVVRSEIRVRTGGAECRRAVEAYRASLELEEHEELSDLVVAKIGQERYVVVAVDRLDSREPSWGVYDQRWREKILFRT